MEPREWQPTLESPHPQSNRSQDMALQQFFVSLNFLLRMIVCYNLDTFNPIIYEQPLDGEKNSHFGMSVAIRPNAASLGDTWILQIGAPRSNVPGSSARQPGTVYRCNMYGPCRMYVMDEGLRGFGGWGNQEFREKKDSAWIGVAMDVEKFGSIERSVVCGHRWINQNIKNPENIDITYLMGGACYLQDFNETFESPVQRLLPLINKDKIYAPKPYIMDLSTYYWGLGQAGISVKLTEEEPSNLLIGAPGVTHWIGSVIRYDGNREVTVGNFARAGIASKSRYAYLGYSIAFGRFFKDKEVWYVAGAPRAANYHGEVFTFRFKDSSDDVHISTTLRGDTFGEYFGSSLATADVNSDGFDDLIVGAPLFSSGSPDEGKIYVYLGTGRGNYLMSAQVITGRFGQGRFGSSVASVGDLDQDGYSDVAVGAPYEEERRGAIYIFRGFSKGLRIEHSQRIGASDIYPQLRGFGVSISTPVDVDGNKYSDVAVGSYLSGHVVLLRSRPVISLHPRIKTENVGLINRKDSYFNVTICSRYSGSNSPRNVDVMRIVDIDPVYGRGTLSQTTSGHRKILHLRSDQILCEILSIKLNLSRKNFSPIQILLRNEIASCGRGKKSPLLIKKETEKKADSFSGTCPLGNKVETTKEISFAGVCGSDLICQPALDLSCEVPHFRTGSYTLGSAEFLLLSMEVKNHGEPAHDAKLKIWSNIKLKHEVSSPTSGQTFWLDVVDILTENYKTNFTFKIDFDALKPDAETRLDLTAQIFSPNLKPESRNLCKLSVKLISEEVLDFSASSTIDRAYVTKPINVTHYYEVRKTGATPLKDAELTIYVPFHLKTEFLTFEMETSEWMHFSQGNDIRHSTKKLWTAEGNCPPNNRTLFLNCSTPDVDCNVVNIFFEEGIPTGFSSYAKIIMILNVTAIDSIRNEKDIVYLSTVGVLKFSKYLEKDSEEIEKSAFVSLYDEERDLHVSAHVIGLSIFAGGFLLFLIVTGLVKSNFFKRTKKEELKALKDADACFVYFTAKENPQARTEENFS